MQVLSRQRGISLIEVMMAVLIFSIGLIGLAGLMVMSTRSNHSAYLRTQVIFLANNMANRMSANPTGVWDGGYNNAAYPVSSSPSGCGLGAACSPDDLATNDQQIWSGQLNTFLPNPVAKIDCTKGNVTGYDPAAQLNRRPPYGGTCKMSIQWSDRDVGDSNHRGSVNQIYAWEFQP